MKIITKIFLKGLAAVLPTAVTVYVLYWLGGTAESLLGRGLRTLISDSLYWPGMGLVAGIALVFVIGVLMNA